MRGTRRRAVALVMLGLGLPACGLVLGIDDGTPRTDGGAIEGGAGDAASDNVAPEDAAEAASPDAGVDVFVDPCAAPHGSVMVRVDGQFCIDRTEATNAQYTQFLASSPSVAAQSAECTWNTTFDPSTPIQNGLPDVAVGYVNWCDAKAFCEWSGMTLCGSLTGAAAAAASYADAQKSAWMYACSHAGDGTHPFPYGTTADPSACNVNAAGRVQVASLPKCEGGYAGIFDMVGNVKEWENACSPAADGGPSQDICRRRGGGFNTAVDTACDYDEADTRDYTYETTGIRCCKY